MERAGRRLDRRQPPRARDRDHHGRRPRRSAPWRCSARSTATGCGWSRSTGVSRELCGGTHVAATSRARPVPPDRRDVERVERAPHRGGHRAGRGAELFEERTAAAARARRAAAGARARGGARRRAPDRAREGAAAAGRATAAPTAATRTSSLAGAAEELGGVQVVVHAVAATEARGAARALRRGPPEARRRPRWCSARPTTAACTWWPTSLPRWWSAA